MKRKIIKLEFSDMSQSKALEFARALNLQGKKSYRQLLLKESGFPYITIDDEPINFGNPAERVKGEGK